MSWADRQVGERRPDQLPGRFRWLLRPSPISAVLLVALAVRAVLVPITHGQDFVVWDLASRATLAGINIYAHHPAYPGGPYAYTPAFLYLELPWQWLALHTGWPFTVLGKAPIMAGDLAVGWLLAARLRAGGSSDAVAAAGAAAFLLNPLVLYNGAFYGRFDSLAVAALLAATSGPDRRRWATAAWFAVAVAIKTFPVVVLPRLLAGGRRPAMRVVLALLAVVGGLTLPYLLTSPGAVLHDVVLYDAAKPAQGLAWQQLILRVAGTSTARVVAALAFVALAVLLVWAAARINDLERYTLLAIVAFLVASPLVLEQYLLWPMPWLILRMLAPHGPAADGGRGERAAAAAMLGALSATGMAVNPYLHPFGTQPIAIAAGLGALCAGYAAVLLRPAAIRPRPLPAGSESD